MRSLIVRFLDCEGPGILESSLRSANYKITYHDAYKKGIHLVPESHQIFDIIVFMGGPQAVYDPNLESFFHHYFELAENALAISGKKVLGICLGSQILAKVLGAKVEKGKNGIEVGFSKVKITDPAHSVFKGISAKELETFHLHGDTFDLPQGASRLISSDKYENQMFVYENKGFGIQCHFEVTYPMLEVWWNVHKEIPSNLGKISSEIKTKQQEMEANARILFDNIISSKAN